MSRFLSCTYCLIKGTDHFATLTIPSYMFSLPSNYWKKLAKICMAWFVREGKKLIVSCFQVSCVIVSEKKENYSFTLLSNRQEFDFEALPSLNCYLLLPNVVDDWHPNKLAITFVVGDHCSAGCLFYDRGLYKLLDP